MWRLYSESYFWRIGLLPKRSEVLHGFTPEELNIHFAGVSISNTESVEDIQGVLATANDERFILKKVTVPAMLC